MPLRGRRKNNFDIERPSCFRTTLEAAAAKRLGKQTKFATKLSLVKMLYGVDLDHSLYTLCNKLNTLRNKLDHDLQAANAPKLTHGILNSAAPAKGAKS